MCSPKPLIGITCSTGVSPDWAASSPGQPQDYAFRNYSRAVEAAGGIPLLLPVPRDPDTGIGMLSALDGLLLAGGADVSPRFYEEEPVVGIGEVDAARDVFEIALTRKAVEAGMPVLGICRGIQLMAVAMGGSLYQDIYAQAQGCLQHNQKAPKDVNTHRVTLETGSCLRELIGTSPVWVNSNHHQAVKRIPPGFQVCARAGDGIIEGIERPGAGFLVGVQWHPEGPWQYDPSSRRLFEGLVRECVAWRRKPET